MISDNDLATILLAALGLVMFLGPLLMHDLPVVMAILSMAGVWILLRVSGLLEVSFTPSIFLFVGACLVIYGRAYRKLANIAKVLYVTGALVALVAASYL